MDNREKKMSPKEECEFLAGILLPFAEKQIRWEDEFYPFGAVLANNNSIEMTNINEENDYPDAKKVMQNLIDSHKQLADKGKIRASGIVWKTVMKDSNGEDIDAITVSLEHKDNYSVVIAKSYKIKGLIKKGIFKIIKFNDLCAFEGKHDIF